MKNVIATWSGGKDSCFATYKAMQHGYTVSYLANTISHDYRRVRFHGVLAELIQKQSEAIGIPLLQKETTPDNYEKEFKENIEQVMDKSIDGIVFGDIHLEDCLAWANKVAKALGIQAVEPLWHVKQVNILKEFINAGFEAVIVSTQGNLLGEEWVGRKIDKKFIDNITKLPHIDSCGENGEYHSFVYNGPLFKKKIEITKAEKVKRDDYWFFDIQEYKLISKE